MLLFAFAANFLSPVMPQAHAAFFDDKLMETIAQNPNAATIQELVKLKQDVASGNKDAIWGFITKTALTRAGKGNIADIATNGNLAQAAADNYQTKCSENAWSTVESISKRD